MSLDAGNIRSEVALPLVVGDLPNEVPIYHTWRDWEPSRISHHGRGCCEFAREWIVHTDFSSLNGANPLAGPRWLRHKFEWGPGRYPIYWCELPKKRKVDCGVLAALAHEVFMSRGVRCFRTQLVQEFTPSTSAQWHAAWKDENAITEWIGDKLIYHEGCAVATRGNDVKLWDSSAGWWMDPKSTSGYGSLAAIKISAPYDSDLRWGEHIIPPGIWMTLRSGELINA
jgi:hypothetical protein